MYSQVYHLTTIHKVCTIVFFFKQVYCPLHPYNSCMKLITILSALWMRTMGLGVLELFTIGHTDTKLSSLYCPVAYPHSGGNGNPTL